MGKYTNKLNAKLKKAHSDYERKLVRTYFTAPEYRNVEMAEEIGKFIHQGKAFHQFPYFKQIATFWQVFYRSYSATRKHHTRYELFTSDYMLMNLFIGISITIGHFVKGLISLPLSLLLKSRNDTHFQKHIGRLINDYATFLHKVPFFNYPYVSKIRPLWSAFWSSPNKTFNDVLSLIIVTIELIGRKAVCLPIAWFYNQPQNKEADRIHLLVKTRKSPAQIKNTDKSIKVVGKILTKKNANGIKHQYAHVTVPRYVAFQRAIEKLVKNHVKIKKIAGQDRIQCKLVIDSQDVRKIDKKQILYTYQNHLNNKKYVELDVTTDKLNNTLNKLEKNNIKINMMHDF